MTRPPITTAILVGGKSTRMGQDKALLEVDGVALAQRAAGLAAPFSGRVVLCGSRDDLGDLGPEVLPDLHPGMGPLAGLEAALTASETDWVLLLACDLPGLDAALLEGLLGRLEGVGEHDAVAVRSARGPEPLVALYHRRLLPEIVERLERGQRAVHRLLLDAKTLWHEVGADPRVANLNTPAELEAWKSNH
ncbi:MAG: molybdenum cofactor guanylyltransferase [Deltaproteobacteria bacterium]|nr:molybdenum cofactor guanylyltransferase [Deltaproteobacteria bacterium]